MNVIYSFLVKVITSEIKKNTILKCKRVVVVVVVVVLVVVVVVVVVKIMIKLTYNNNDNNYENKC